MLIWISITSPIVKDVVRWRQSRDLTKFPPSFNIWDNDNQYLVVSVPETEYPCYIPSNVTTCGPILLPECPISEQDPKLDAWLNAAPTLLINLGSHSRMDEQMVRQFALALRIVLRQKSHIQVLWKLKTSGGVEISSRSKNTASKRVDESSIMNNLLEVGGRLKIVEWLSVDPLAVMRNKNVICSVHQYVGCFLDFLFPVSAQKTILTSLQWRF